MLPLAVNQCSVWFTVFQSLVGGLLGSLGFIINMLVVGGIYKAYQKYKLTKDGAKPNEPVYAGKISVQ